MTNEELLVDIVETWATEIMPDDAESGRAAAAVALHAYVAGASVSEACREARSFLRGRAAHPSRRCSSSRRRMQLVAS